MADSDTVSNCSSGPSDLLVMDQLDADDLDAESDLQAATGRLQTVLTLQPDANINANNSDNGSLGCDTDSIGAASTSSSTILDHRDPNSDDSCGESESVNSDKVPNHVSSKGESLSAGNTDQQNKSGAKPKVKDESKKSRNPFRMLKKLTKFDKPKKKDQFSEFDQVRIDKLPQVFVVKYLGKRETHGFCGLHHVRKPVDEMVTHVQKSLKEKEHLELPLVYVVVSPKGLDVHEHKMNKQKEGVPLGLTPIDFISYGVQDIKYWRVFTFIVVRELSSRSKATECHAYLCDCAVSARKMALSLGASFRVYSRTLRTEGKVHNFQVELRPPDELADAFAKEFEA